MESESCPACGDGFERKTQEKARNSVIAHMCSKNDDDHLGIGFEKASQMIDYADISDADISDSISENGSKDIDSPESTETTTTIDGPRDPPEPDVATDGGALVEDVDEPTAPDGFEAVDEVCDDLESRYPEISESEDWQTQRSKLERQFDFVRVEYEEGGDPSIVDGISRVDL